LQNIKAGIFACLFLFPYVTHAQEWKFTSNQQRAHQLVFDLRMADARNILGEANSAADLYIISLSEIIELLLSEDPQQFHVYERRFESRMSDKSGRSTPAAQFLQAEMRLQWAFVYLKFGKELDAAFNLKSAYSIAETCRKKNPKFVPIRKTTGLLQVMMGAVPEKYNWLLSMLGMRGSISAGLKDLDLVRNSASDFSNEAHLLHALIQTFVLQNTEEGALEIGSLVSSSPKKLETLLAAAVAIKNAESKVALSLLEGSVFNNSNDFDLIYRHYLIGEAYLHRNDYGKAINAYQLFIAGFKGKNYLKDAYYKIGLCHWLNGSPDKSNQFFAKARAAGTEASEADKHAARMLSSDELPNVLLSKVRYFTDGGYYAEADSTLVTITPADLPTKKDQAEYYYRKARISHKQKQYAAAKLFYAQALGMCGEENWYFAANATLQLGYLAMEENDIAEARRYFFRALEFRKHEYKNSIDSKARSALSQLKTR